MISFRLRTKWQNCRGYVPRYERPPKNGWFDIHSVFATHVETVVLLSKLHEAKHHVNVTLDMDELDITSAESKATYEEIRNWVQEQYGFHVTNLNIAQIKQKHGIIERENYNKAKSEDSRQPRCPEEKINAIEDAMRHFQMID